MSYDTTQQFHITGKLYVWQQQPVQEFSMTDDFSCLNIFNGDIACKLGLECGITGETLVWRETYLEGPLLETDDLHLFRSVRAEFLSQFDELEGVGSERLYRHLQKMDETLLELPENSRLMLWFDCCMFDQTMLMRILYLLAQRKTPLRQVFLYCCKTNILTAEDFLRGSSESVRLADNDLEVASQAWKLYVQKDSGAMREFAGKADFRNLAAMKKALLRCAEEVPDANGLNRSQKQILQLVAAGRHSFEEIFKALGQLEEYPFLGDTACKRYLEYLTGKGLLICKNGIFKKP